MSKIDGCFPVGNSATTSGSAYALRDVVITYRRPPWPGPGAIWGAGPYPALGPEIRHTSNGDTSKDGAR